jgi:Bucentaur or craniofacial development
MTSGTAKTTAESRSEETTPTEAKNDHIKAPQVMENGHSDDGARIQLNSPGRPVPKDLNGEDMIMIQRTYNFAGKVHVEEKLVARDSAEARLWQESQSSGKNLNQPIDPNITKPLRPPKKARRSVFEPITEPLPQRTDLRFGVGAAGRNGIAAGANSFGAAKKLNTVEKSKMDWAGFVDKEGIKDELEIAGKSKGAYLDQKEFLARVEEKREEEARKARLKV